MVAWLTPSPSVIESEGSGRSGWIESVGQLGELFDHADVVAVGMVANEVDHLAIAIGCLSAIAARLMQPC